MVNEKIAKFRNQFLEQSSRASILSRDMDTKKGIKVYKAAVDKNSSAEDTETLTSAASRKEEDSRKDDDRKMEEHKFDHVKDDIKSKLTLSYEKLDLQRKLADMMSTITSFKTSYEAPAPE